MPSLASSLCPYSTWLSPAFSILAAAWPAALLPAGKPVIVAVGGGLPGPGYTFIADESVGADVWRALTSQVRSKNSHTPTITSMHGSVRCCRAWQQLAAGWVQCYRTGCPTTSPLSFPPSSRLAPACTCTAPPPDHTACPHLPCPPSLLQEGVEPLGSDAWGMARVLAGRPAPGSELTEDFNPLEAGLYHALSVSKGCYIGQETIAKVGGRVGGCVLVALMCVWQEPVRGWVMRWRWVGDGERGP